MDSEIFGKGNCNARARTFYTQILNAYGTNAYRYSDAHKGSESETVRKQRLSQAIHAVEFGQNLISDVARKERDRNGSPFLKRIQASDAVEAEENLKATDRKLKKMMKNDQ